MQSIRCHYCGGVMGEVPEIKRLHNELSKREFSVVEAILAAGENGIKGLDLAVTVFGERLGRTESKASHIRKLVSSLRTKVERFGYFIPKVHGSGMYRIEPLEASV